MADTINNQEAEASTEKTPTNGDGFRVIRLSASNVKRLRAVDITPDPKAPLVIVAGNNGEGKSSAIDSILYALGGKDAVCADPIRHGQTKASAEVDLGSYIAKRRFSPAGQTLELKTKEGLNVPSPQTVLDNLRGVLNFDPLAFSRMNAKARFETLRELVHLDIDLPALETKRKALYDSRTELSRRHRDFEGELRQTPEPDADLPGEKIDVGALMAEKNRLMDVRRGNDLKRRRLAEDLRALDTNKELIADTEAQIKALQTRLEDLQQKRAAMVSAYESIKPGVMALTDPDTTEIDAQIAAASDTNTRIERAAQYRERRKKLGAMGQEIAGLTDNIEALDQKKADALAAAQFPIDGLSFADGDVSYNGVLFDQLSSAEQVRVSLAMAMAMNPKLRVILIKDGSLLDETSLGIIREMAQERGFQIWVEVVGNRADATVIIEDGRVVEAETSEPTHEVTA